MKTIKIILAALFASALLSSCGEKKIEIEQKGDIFYIKDTKEKYSGTCTQLNDNGKTSYQGQIKEGKKEGIWIWYHENGIRRLEESYSNGLLDGDRKGYNPEGKLVFTVKYKKGIEI